MTLSPPTRIRHAQLATLPGRGLRLMAVTGRFATICLLMPIVLLFGVVAFVALAVIGTVRLARPASARPPADVRFHSRATAERVESLAVRQAA